jgi:hypothetical protein
MSATYYAEDGVTVCISDEAYRMYEADAAAAMAEQDAKERRQSMREGLVAGVLLVFSIYELITQAGSLT